MGLSQTLLVRIGQCPPFDHALKQACALFQHEVSVNVGIDFNGGIMSPRSVGI